jgi:hypothetical protein
MKKISEKGVRTVKMFSDPVYPLRKVIDGRDFETPHGWAMILRLECGHEQRRKNSMGVPERARCKDCQPVRGHETVDCAVAR